MIENIYDSVTAKGKEYGEIWTLIRDENIINKVKFSLIGID